MVLECLTWIPHIWGQLVSPFTIFCRKSPARPIPDDITIEILSRLPVDCVLECRRVCKNWRALTSSPYFAELQLKRSAIPPSLFLHWLEYGPPMKREQLNFFIYDKAGQKAHRKKSIITKVRPKSGVILYHYNPMVLGSCNGLLMFVASRSAPMIFILNPITQELSTLPAPLRLTTPCGIYCHPSTCEYKLLFSVYMEETHLQCYYTYSLKSKVRKQLNYSSLCKTRGSPPAILMNGSLHWMVNCNGVHNNASNPICTDAIMVFGTETEDIRVLPHPGPKRCYYREEEHENMYILGTREHLCLCLVLRGQVIYVWVLEDYANWGWDRRYKVNLNWDAKRFPYVTGYRPRYNPKFLKVLGILNGELVIAWYLRGVFLYNLEQNTVSKIEITVEGSSMLPLPLASTYTKSLVSLRYLFSGL